MTRNTFGNLFRLTTFGESHGLAVGGVVDGMPAGIGVDEAFLQRQLDRRRPGQSTLTTSRQEADRLEILSGVFQGQTTGQPIGFIVHNQNQHSADYSNLAKLFRPSHADYTYWAKFGIRDHRGGGRSSARETISRVVGGAFAQLALQQLGVSITAWTSQVGGIVAPADLDRLDFDEIERNPVRCPHAETASQMAQLIKEVKADGDTIGGCISCLIRKCPVGLGEPAFGKLHAALAGAMLSINAAKGFEYGRGFEGAAERGSEQNDEFEIRDGQIRTRTNRSGGIQGGISNGEDIYFRVAFKPVATILRPQQTVDSNYHPATLEVRGRHDPCVLPRAVPVVEAMAAMTILDYYLLNRTTRLPDEPATF